MKNDAMRDEIFEVVLKNAFADAFVKLFDHYVSISFSDEEPLRLGEYQLAYLPKGYALSYSREGRISSNYRFSDGENELSLVITRSPYSNIMIDNEYHTFEPVEIGGMSGCKAIPTDATRDVMLVWGDETWSYMLNGKVPIETLVRMAKSLAKAAPDVAGE